jgi:hypothetical protein
MRRGTLAGIGLCHAILNSRRLIGLEQEKDVMSQNTKFVLPQIQHPCQQKKVASFSSFCYIWNSEYQSVSNELTSPQNGPSKEKKDVLPLDD